MLKINSSAPDFRLFDQDGKEHMLSEHRGRWVLLYFYPKDNTPGCTTEAMTFRDRFTEFQKLGVEVLGVSADSVESHRAFADRFRINFPLLSDPKKEAIDKYQANGVLRVRRVSYLIDPQGRIYRTYERVNPENHSVQVYEDLKNAIAI